jgi:hypothetical protein
MRVWDRAVGGRAPGGAGRGIVGGRVAIEVRGWAGMSTFQYLVCAIGADTEVSVSGDAMRIWWRSN